MRLLRFIVFALALGCIAPLPARAQQVAPTAVATLPSRQANYAWDRTLLRASFSYRDVVDGSLTSKLSNGLPTVIAMRAYVFAEGQDTPVALAVGTCAWSAAVLLAADSARGGDDALAGWFGRRALATGLVVGALALTGVAVLRADAPTLAHRLQGRGVALVLGSAAAGALALARVARGRYAQARLPALVAVVAVVAGWGVAQYPWLLVDHVRIADAAAPRPTLVALLVAFAAAATLVLPSLALLLRYEYRGTLAEGVRADSSEAALMREP